MSEQHTEVWAELERLSRRIALQEQRMLERILALEEEIKALKGQTPAGRDTYPDGRDINWREGGMARVAISEIMAK